MKRGWLWLGVAVCTAACADISGLARLEVEDAAQAEIDADARADVVVLPSCGDAGVCIDVPSGYSVVDYAPTGQPECAPGSANAQDLAENPQSATESCSCTSCQITPTVAPTCSCGGSPAAFDVAWSTGTNCTVGGTAEVLASTTCYVKTESLGFASSFSIKPDAGCKPSGGACKNASPFGSSFTTKHDTGRRCDVADASITNCAGGGSCVPTASSGFLLCVTDGTMNACPSEFPTSHVVGTSVVDTRSCNCAACTITSAGTCQTNVTFYSSNDCTTGSVKVPADGTCFKTSNNTSFSSASYASTENGAQCGGGAAYVDGGLSLAGSYRICCL